MKKCCKQMLDEIKKYISLQASLYMNTRRWAVGKALELLREDLIEQYECFVTESKANDSK